jgi:hypothetical protein
MKNGLNSDVYFAISKFVISTFKISAVFHHPGNTGSNFANLENHFEIKLTQYAYKLASGDTNGRDTPRLRYGER